MPEQSRPTKKQRELLIFIESFIAQHGYGPSYREIMKGCSYTSVATVALHVNNLIARGLLSKNGRSARSLELLEPGVSAERPLATNAIKPADEKWLVNKIEHKFCDVENSTRPSQSDIDSLYVLVGALKVLGLDGAANSFITRLSQLRKRL